MLWLFVQAWSSCLLCSDRLKILWRLFLCSRCVFLIVSFWYIRKVRKMEQMIIMKEVLHFAINLTKACGGDVLRYHLLWRVFISHWYCVHRDRRQEKSIWKNYHFNWSQRFSCLNHPFFLFGNVSWKGFMVLIGLNILSHMTTLDHISNLNYHWKF